MMSVKAIGDLNTLPTPGMMNESSSLGSINILKTHAENGVESWQENDKENAIGDLNTLPAAGMMNESSSNGIILKTQAENGAGSCQESDKEKAIGDLNTLPAAGMMNESSSNGIILNSQAENGAQSCQENDKEKTVSIVQADINGDSKLNSGTEVGNSEVEYIESENLNDVEDDNASLKTLLAGLESKDWVLVCEALNDVRRLCIFHKETMLEMLEKVISLIVKSLKNPRSAVCKTAIMTSADIFKAYGEHIVDTMDPMLLQLLLKSSQDKRFVCEAAERSLITMTTWVSPALLLPKLQPYLKHRNPRIRAKASMCFSRSVPNLGVDGIEAYGLEKLIQIGASQLSDQLPESREAARALLLELQTVYEKKMTAVANEDDSETISWEHFCQSKLSRLSAQAVLRVTNVPREGSLVLGS